MTGGAAWSTAYLFAGKPYIAALCLSVILVGFYAMKMAFNGITKQNTLIFSHLILIVCTVIPLTDYLLLPYPVRLTLTCWYMLLVGLYFSGMNDSM
jgi:uncharacterized membrane protein